MAMKKCPVCGVSVKVENLERHLRNQHPRDRVDLSDTLTQEDREMIKESKGTGRPAMTAGGRRVVLAVAIVAVALLAVAIAYPYLVTSTPHVGQQAPGFSLTSTDGQHISLSSFRGSPVLLELMDPDCSHCVDEAPILASIYSTYSARGVQFLSIAINIVGATDTIASVNAFRTQYGTSWPYCIDSEHAVATAYEGNALQTPWSFVIAQNGTIYRSIAGAQSASTFAAAFDAVLGG